MAPFELSAFATAALCRAAPNLRAVCVTAASSDAVVGGLAKLSGLTSLELPYTRCEDEPLAALCACGQLQQLSLSSATHVTEAGLAALAAGSRNLRLLDLLDVRAVHDIACLSVCTSLETVRIGGSAASTIAGVAELKAAGIDVRVDATARWAQRRFA